MRFLKNPINLKKFQKFFKKENLRAKWQKHDITVSERHFYGWRALFWFLMFIPTGIWALYCMESPFSPESLLGSGHIYNQFETAMILFALGLYIGIAVIPLIYSLIQFLRADKVVGKIYPLKPAKTLSYLERNDWEKADFLKDYYPDPSMLKEWLKLEEEM